MKAQNSQTRRIRLMRGLFLFPMLVMSLLPAKAPVIADFTQRVDALSRAHAHQDPNLAQKYRRLAEAKREEAERVPEKKNCYLAWARYYDCLAERADAGDNRQCPPRPEDC